MMTEIDPETFFPPDGSIDMPRQPTPQEALAISRFLREAGFSQLPPTPLTEQEACWLQGFIREALDSSVHIRLVEAQSQQEQPERLYALELAYPNLAPVNVHSLADWHRIQRWAAEPACFLLEGAAFSEQQQRREWERIQRLRAIIFASAREAGQRASQRLAARIPPTQENLMQQLEGEHTLHRTITCPQCWQATAIAYDPSSLQPGEHLSCTCTACQKPFVWIFQESFSPACLHCEKSDLPLHPHSRLCVRCQLDQAQKPEQGV